MPDSCVSARAEIDAFFQQGYLIARHSLLPVASQPHLRSDRAVLFIHGFLAGGAVFAPLRVRVENECKLATYDHTYLPYQRFDDIVARLSEALWRVVETGARVSLVGHSLGGLLARVLVQERGFFRHVDCIVTLATPHAGTTRARGLPGSLPASLRPKSEVFARLEATRDALSNVKCVAIGAGADLMIAPRTSALAWPEAQTHLLHDLGHNAILFDTRAQDLVIDQLR